ncbi:MAG: OmpH family outer membrane protein [Planctomycetota bacterium]
MAMQKRNGLLAGAALGVAGVLGVGIGLGAGVAYQSAEATAVAVVDIDAVSAELEEFKARVGEINVKREARVAELRAISERIGEINVELEALTEAEQARGIELSIEGGALQNDLQFKQGAFQQEADLLQAALTRELYGKITEAVTRIAERDGYDIVLFDDKSISLNDQAAASFAGSVEAIKSKKVLYASDVVDLTNSVLALMNNEYAAGG